MKVEPRAVRPTPEKRTGAGSRTSLLVVLSAVVLSALATFAATIHWLVPDPGQKTRQWRERRGDGAYGRVPLARALGQAPKLMSRSVPDLPHLVIDVKFQHMQKIRAKRQEALQRGILMATSDDLVPASIRFGERTIPVRLRLKGDTLTHLEGRKWSYRIEVRGGDQILGMRRFSIQHPTVRGFQGETLIFETMRRMGVATPRYFFVEVTVNGTGMGMMALEEHFSKELLGFNQRPEGVILRFDESLVWSARTGGTSGFGGIFDDFRNAPIRPFRATRVSESEKLSREYAAAAGLLRGFVDGTLRPSEVFDVALMGRFLAVAEFWASWHPLRWNNLRFYMNPITARLEPIAFDANVSSRGSPRVTVCQNEPVARALLADREVFEAYGAALERLSAEVLEGDLPEVLKAVEERHLPALQKEFFFLRGFPWEELQDRARRFRARSREELESPFVRVRDYPVLIHASLVTGAEPPYVELASAVPHEVEIRSLGWGADPGQAGVALEPLAALELPLRLPGRRWDQIYPPLRIPYRPPGPAAGSSLGVVVRLPGRPEMWVVAAQPTVAALARHPIPAPTLEEALAAHPFLSRDGDGRTLRVAPGTWQVAGSLAVPPGFGLAAGAGTTLRFAASEGLIVQGPVVFEGTAERPVVLEGGDGGWQGIVVLRAGGPSRWRQVTVRDTTGLRRAGWELTGGTAFYRSDVEMTDCLFEGNRAEDALNVISSDYRLEGVLFVDAASDALDSDFSSGTIAGGRFENVGHVGGGDAIDVSGGRVEIEGVRFSNIADKALSVGERSELTATALVIEKAGVGAACKDGSRLTLSDSTISEVGFAALAAYVKKPEFGPAWLEARDVRYQGAAPRARAQNGSTLLIDGVRVAGEELDVEQLYATIMRPGLRR